jgi:hypothetical protein
MITFRETLTFRRGAGLSIHIHRNHPMTRRAWRAPLALAVLLFQYTSATPADRDVPEDAYLTGYVSALLERQLQWEPGSFRVETQAGIATVILYTQQPGRARAAQNALAGTQGLRGLRVRIQPAGAAGTAPYTLAHPLSDLFPPLLADPKAPQSSIAFVHVNADTSSISAALVSLGGEFGFYQWRAKPHGYQWQMGIFAAVLSQFNLDAPSEDLINTDYLIGLPLTFRRDTYSGRLRIFHQSSHLGDESILHGTAPARVIVDYEALDLLLAKDIASWRAYGGGEYMFRRNTTELDRTSLLAGVDYRSSDDLVWGARLVGGVHVRWLQQRDWAAGTSLKIGLEFGQPHPVRRGSRLMLEAYNGYAPFGQFYVYDVSYYGLGYYVDF